MQRTLLSILIGASLGSAALAAPMAILPPGPLYMQFNNLEQNALGLNPATGRPLNNTDTCTGCSGKPEGNWGIAQVSLIRPGATSPSGALPGALNNDITSLGTPAIFVDQLVPTGAQITAMFYGATVKSIVTSGTVNSVQYSGGFVDLYWDDASLANTIVNINSLTPSGRTGDASFAGITDGTLLAHLALASGINPASNTTSMQGTIDTGLVQNSGSTDSYAVVADLNGDGKITAADGLWATQLNTDWFGTVFGTRDVRLSAKVNNNTAWNGAAGSGIYGQSSNDPLRAMVGPPITGGEPLPEPGALTLVSLGLLGLLALRRRQGK